MSNCASGVLELLTIICPFDVMRSLSLSVELDGSLVSKYRCPPTLLPPLAYAATLALVVLPVLLQKSIVPIAVPSDTDAFIEYCTKDLKLPIIGLMCIPPQDEEAVMHFALLKKIAARNNLNELSMGMSNDFEEAIKFGATSVRIGSLFFGPRSI